MLNSNKKYLILLFFLSRFFVSLGQDIARNELSSKLNLIKNIVTQSDPVVLNFSLYMIEDNIIKDSTTYYLNKNSQGIYIKVGSDFVNVINQGKSIFIDNTNKILNYSSDSSFLTKSTLKIFRDIIISLTNNNININVNNTKSIYSINFNQNEIYELIEFGFKANSDNLSYIKVNFNKINENHNIDFKISFNQLNNQNINDSTLLDIGTYLSMSGDKVVASTMYNDYRLIIK